MQKYQIRGGDIYKILFIKYKICLFELFFIIIAQKFIKIWLYLPLNFYTIFFPVKIKVI